MEATYFSEISVGFQLTTRLYVQEDRTLRDISSVLKSKFYIFVLLIFKFNFISDLAEKFIALRVRNFKIE
jgi:hypothetical protein